MLNNRQKVVIKDEDYRLPPNVLETDFMKPVHGKDIVSTVITHLLCNVERMLKDMNIELFKNEYYHTTRYAKLSTNLSKLQLFVIRDYEDQRRVVVSSRVVQISEDYTSQEFCSEIYAHSFSYDLLEDKYLVSLDQVEMDDKLIVFKFLLDSLFEIPGAKWESQEAAAAKLKEGGSDEHHADIYMTYPAIEVASKRFFIGDAEPVPVTLRILSQAGMPLGLSCCVYDVANTTEYPALFLIIHPSKFELTKTCGGRNLG